VDKLVISNENEKFLKKISELSGQVITSCDQCGVCSGSCPMTLDMDITPSMMMRKVQLGQQEVLENKTPWICASCFTCTVRCPRGLDLSKVAEALRQVKLRESIDRVNINAIPEEELIQLPQIALVGCFRKCTG